MGGYRTHALQCFHDMIVTTRFPWLISTFLRNFNFVYKCFRIHTPVIFAEGIINRLDTCLFVSREEELKLYCLTININIFKNNRFRMNRNFINVALNVSQILQLIIKTNIQTSPAGPARGLCPLDPPKFIKRSYYNISIFEASSNETKKLLMNEMKINEKTFKLQFD